MLGGTSLFIVSLHIKANGGRGLFHGTELQSKMRNAKGRGSGAGLHCALAAHAHL